MIKIRQILVGLPILATICLSCDNKNQEAQDLLQRADSAYRIQDFVLAQKLSRQVDSIAPTDTILRHKALDLSRRSRLGAIDLQLDSLEQAFASAAPRIRAMEEKFGRMQDLEDGTTLKMILPVLAPYRNQGRTYLRMATDTMGRIDLTSVYSGIRPLKHAAIRLTDVATEQTIATHPVQYDQGLNYRYVSGGRHYELVSYPMGEAVRIGELICTAAESGRGIEVIYLSGEGKRTGVSYRVSGRILADLGETVRLAEAYRQRAQGRDLHASISREKAYLGQKTQEVRDY